MSVTHIRKAISYIKDTQDIALFTSFADQRWAAAFRQSTLFYLILPFIGLLLTINAIIAGYQLAKASNRNFDHWFHFLGSVSCAVLASISLYGAVIAMVLGVTFVAGPWLFLGGTIIGFGQQLLLLGLNSYRAAECPAGSIQRMHYVQEALSNVSVMTLIAAVIGTILFAMLFPIAPLVGSVCALTAVGLTALNLLWRVIPHPGKLVIKGWFHLNKPNIEDDARANQDAFACLQNELDAPTRRQRIVTQIDYCAVTRIMDVSDAKRYLAARIDRKLHSYAGNDGFFSEKTSHKTALLRKLNEFIDQPHGLSRTELLEQYPLAFQSFWAEKGEAEQLFDAVISLSTRGQEQESRYLS